MKSLEMSGHSFKTNDSCDSVVQCVQENFYSPLCMSGYLTPLQRRKLREKRKMHATDDIEPEVRNTKRKNKCLGNVRKKPHPISKQKEKTKVPQLRCTVSKIIHKSVGGNVKDRKFFKTSSIDRLENVIFTLPFTEKMSGGLKNESSSKDVQSFQKTIPVSTEIAIQSEPVLDSQRPLRSVDTNVDEDVVSESNTVDTQISEMETVSETSLSEDPVFDFGFPSDEVLLERQEKARMSARKLRESNSSKNCSVSENISEPATENVKLYPIFYHSKKTRDSQEVKRPLKNVSKCIRDSSKGGEQMILDAGQKDIGVKICEMCDMIYTIGQEEDEKLHSEYHNKYLTNLKFLGWKDENVIGEYQDGRVLMVRKDDKNLKLKKVEDVLEIANRDLGFPSAGLPTKPDVTFILYILNDKRIVGCVVAERISLACRVMLAENNSSSNSTGESVWRIGNWYSSMDSVPAVCGINRIWVARDFRRKKVASRMIDCLRCNFIHGHVISIRELAFTDPSADGRDFAAAYTGTDHFLVYK